MGWETGGKPKREGLCVHRKLIHVVQQKLNSHTPINFFFSYSNTSKKMHTLYRQLLNGRASLIAQLVKNPPAMQETLVPFLGRKICWRRDRLPTPVFLGFPCGSADKESACNAGDLGSIPGLGGSPGEGKGYPLQYSGLENSMDTVQESLLSDFRFHFSFIKRQKAKN